MNSNLFEKLLISVLLFSSCPSHAAPATSYTGSVSFISDNNLGLGKYKRDIVSDSAQNFNFNISHGFNFNRSNKLFVDAAATLEDYNEFNGLDNNAIDLKASYFFQFSHNFRSPVYGIYFQTGQSDFKSQLRDNIHTQYGLTLSWNYDDRTLFRAGFGNESVDADSTWNGSYETFDNKRSSVYFGINIAQTARLSLYSSLSLISGKITANWTSQTLDAYAVNFNTIRDAWDTIDDEIFGINRESTRYNADITKLALGFNYAFSRSNAIDMQFELLNVSGTYAYSNERLSLSYLHRF